MEPRSRFQFQFHLFINGSRSTDRNRPMHIPAKNTRRLKTSRIQINKHETIFLDFVHPQIASTCSIYQGHGWCVGKPCKAKYGYTFPWILLGFCPEKGDCTESRVNSSFLTYLLYSKQTRHKITATLQHCTRDELLQEKVGRENPN